MTEKQLNYYFNINKLNHPASVGYLMNGIRARNPSTLNEWKTYYYANIHTKEYLEELGIKMYNLIPINEQMQTSIEECQEYIKDAVLRRTYVGFNSENKISNIISKALNVKIYESSEEWDSRYFIDLYIKNDPLIAIHVKPTTFYRGGYGEKIDFNKVHEEFMKKYNSVVFNISYEKHNDEIIFNDLKAIEQIRTLLKKEGENEN
jgi:hypothetical protein